MATTERYQVNVFAIVVLITAVLMLVFLIIAAIYFFNLMRLRPPSRGESMALFWTTIILALLFLFIIVYSLIHIFTHKSLVYEETAKPAPIVASSVVVPPPAIVTTPALISNIPGHRTSLVTSVSDVPLTQSQKEAEEAQLLSLGQVFRT